MEEFKVTCKKCKSDNVAKFGSIPTVNAGRKQRYRCQDCGKTFYSEGICSDKRINTNVIEDVKNKAIEYRRMD